MNSHDFVDVLEELGGEIRMSPEALDKYHTKLQEISPDYVPRLPRDPMTNYSFRGVPIKCDKGLSRVRG